MKRLVAYLGGPIAAHAVEATYGGWRLTATSMLEAIGVEAVNPVLLLQDIEPNRTEFIDREWAKRVSDACLESVRSCNVLLINGNSPSDGTAIELFDAFNWGVPSIVFGYHLRIRNDGHRQRSAFLETYANQFVPDLPSAIEAIASMRGGQS